MWLLDVHIHGSGIVRYYLTAGSFSIGRKEGCNIHVSGSSTSDSGELLGTTDASISRLHATIHVMAVQAKSLPIADHVPDCFVSDHSKHGTFVNNDRIAAHEVQRRVGAGDVIRLGLHATVSLQYTPLIIAVSPRLSSFEYREVHSLASRLGATLVSVPTVRSEWHHKGIAASAFFYVCHDVHDDDTSLLFGLLFHYTLVTPEYLSGLADLLRGTPHLPMSRWPQPRGVTSATTSRSLSDRQYFRPAPTFFDGRDFVDEVPPQDPTHVFRTLRLLCLDSAIWERYHLLITSAGGKAVRGRIDNRPRHPVSLHDVTTNTPLPLDNLVPEKLDAHGFGTYLLVASADFRALADVLETHRQHEREHLRQEMAQPSTGHRQGDGLLAPATHQLATYFFLWERGVRVVDEENIHAALYTNDAAREFQHDAPGILCRTAMDELPEVEACDSNATEDGILPYRRGSPFPFSNNNDDEYPASQATSATSRGQAPAAHSRSAADAHTSSSRPSSPIRVCSAQQLSNHKIDHMKYVHRHNSDDAAAQTSSQDSAAGASHNIPRVGASSSVLAAAVAAGATDLYANWKQTAQAAHARATSPTRRGPPPPASTTLLAQQQQRSAATTVTTSRAAATATTQSSHSYVSPLRNRSPDLTRRSSLITAATHTHANGTVAQAATALAGVAASTSSRAGSPTRRGSVLFKPVARTIGCSSDQQLLDLCNAFEQGALARIAIDTETACERILVAGYVDGPCLATIRDATETFDAFLKALSDAEKSFTSSVLSSGTRRTAFRLREKIDTIQRAIRASHRAVGIAVPNAMPSPRRYSSPTARPQSSPARQFPQY